MRITALVVILTAASSPAFAQRPILKDAERFAIRPERRVERRVIEVIEPAPMLALRRCCSGDVGSAYGLGKPNYYGISPRPHDETLD